MKELAICKTIRIKDSQKCCIILVLFILIEVPLFLGHYVHSLVLVTSLLTNIMIYTFWSVNEKNFETKVLKNTMCLFSVRIIFHRRPSHTSLVHIASFDNNYIFQLWWFKSYKSWECWDSNTAETPFLYDHVTMNLRWIAAWFIHWLLVPHPLVPISFIYLTNYIFFFLFLGPSLISYTGISPLEKLIDDLNCFCYVYVI